MTDHEASRTLVKSPPELWTECSVAESLARHLDHFGEIRITRLEPETAVAWEGEDACGTVRLEPSGWGTKVTLTARQAGPAVESEASEPQPSGATERSSAPTGTTRRRWLGRLLVRLLAASERAPRDAHAQGTRPADAAVDSECRPQVEPPPTPGELALATALDSLGSAHHRPFSRA